MTHPSLSATHNTTETGNSQGHRPEFKESYHLVRHRTHCQRHPNLRRAPGPFLGERVLIVYAPQFLKGGNTPSLDRAALGLEPAVNAAKGVYYFMKPQGEPEGVIFVQGAGAGRIFAQEVLPKLKEQHTSLAVIYVASRELFEMLPQQEQDRLVPPSWKQIATGITDFTLPTLDGWLHSDMGRACALWPHKNGGYLGSGAASKVYEEAGMDAQGQLRAVREYLELRKKGSWR